MKNFGRYWKAVIGFITPGAVAYYASVQIASPGGAATTQQEWAGIGLAMILTGGGVLAAKNAPASPTPVQVRLRRRADPADVGEAV